MMEIDESQVLPRCVKYMFCNVCGMPEKEGVHTWVAYQVEGHGEYVTNSYECAACAALGDKEKGRLKAQIMNDPSYEQVWIQGDILD